MKQTVEAERKEEMDRLTSQFEKKFEELKSI